MVGIRRRICRRRRPRRLLRRGGGDDGSGIRGGERMGVSGVLTVSCLVEKTRRDLALPLPHGFQESLLLPCDRDDPAAPTDFLGRQNSIPSGGSWKPVSGQFIGFRDGGNPTGSLLRHFSPASRGRSPRRRHGRVAMDGGTSKHRPTPHAGRQLTMEVNSLDGPPLGSLGSRCGADFGLEVTVCGDALAWDRSSTRFAAVPWCVIVVFIV